MKKNSADLAFQDQASLQEAIQPLASTPETPKQKTGLIAGVIILALALLGITGIFAYQNFQLKKQVAKILPTPTPKTTNPTPTANPTASWKTFKIETIGLEFKVSPQITKMGNFREKIFPGEKGNALNVAFISSSSGAFLKFGTTSVDYEAGRMAGFGDLQEYKIQNGKYYAELLGKSFEIPSDLVEEVTNSNGIKILKVIGKNSTEGEWQGPIAGTPGDGWIGALINIDNNPKYLGIAVQMELKENLTPEIFDQILSTFEFLDQEQADETKNWKTYKNEKFGYSIKYPASFYVTESESAVTFTFEPEPTGGWGPGPLDKIEIGSSNSSNSFDALYKAKQGDDVIEEHHADCVKVTKLNNLKFGNHNAVEYIYDGLTFSKSDLCQRGAVGYSHIILIKKNNQRFFELINTSMEVEETKQRDPIFNQMVSTLQLVQ